jgi:hypothetical protein
VSTFRIYGPPPAPRVMPKPTWSPSTSARPRKAPGSAARTGYRADARHGHASVPYWGNSPDWSPDPGIRPSQAGPPTTGTNSGTRPGSARRPGRPGAGTPEAHYDARTARVTANALRPAPRPPATATIAAHVQASIDAIHNAPPIDLGTLTTSPNDHPFTPTTASAQPGPGLPAPLNSWIDNACVTGNHWTTLDGHTYTRSAQIFECSPAGAPSRSQASPGCDASNSFTPDTPILMADGTTRPIAHIKIGDHVLTTDPHTGHTSPQPVTQLITGHGLKSLVTLTIDTDGPHGNTTGTLTATNRHPFWVESQKRWTNAEDLHPGGLLHTPTGEPAQILTTHARHHTQQVHNLTIADLHTYYVVAGDTPVLVHNCGTGPGGLIDLEKASASGAAPDKGRTAAGRALQKHAGRAETGPNWPRPSGAQNPAGWDKTGQAMLDDILTSPDSVAHLGYGRVGGVWQDTLDVRLPGGLGARFDLDGIFSGFLD